MYRVVLLDEELWNQQLLEQLRELRQNSADIECIILTTNQNFFYAQQAVPAGSAEYCLNPIKFTELPAIIESLTEKSSMKNHKLDVFINSPAAFSDFLKEHNADNFRVCIISEQDKNVIAKTTKNYYDYFPIENNRLLFFLTGDVINLYGQLSAPMGISAVHPRSELGALSAACTEARIAEASAFLYPDRKSFIYYPRNIYETNKIVEVIISITSRDELLEYMNILPERFEQKSLTIKDLEYMWNRLISHILATDETAELDFTNFEEIIKQFGDFDTFRIYILSHLGQKIEQKTQSGDLEHAQLAKIVQYINDHLSENILLKDLAKTFYLNANYCSYLFNKHMGISYSEYINNEKIDRAKTLLRETTLSVAEVASRVGFNDYFYFNKVFKKIVGITPKKYRGEIN